MLADYWPIEKLRIEAPNVTLAYTRESDLGELTRILKDVHDTPTYEWLFSNQYAFEDRVELRFLQTVWSSRGSWSREGWWMPLTVFENGEIRGMQELSAKNFPLLQFVETGSWIDPPHQGRGLGKEMRAAILRFSFEYLCAQEAGSNVLLDNRASNAVSTHLGYETNGFVRVTKGATCCVQQRYRMTREMWLRNNDLRELEINVAGFEDCRNFFMES